MSRYTGPRLRVMRALGVELPGLAQKTLQHRPQPPGQHGPGKASGRKSEYGLQLQEKQKLRFNYGLRESQLRRIVVAAKRIKGATGGSIIELLECRFDNLVFRAGFAPTIPSARQMISHGHFELNGRRVTVPSIRVRNGESFGPAAKGKEHNLVQSTLQSPALERPDWIAFDAGTTRAILVHRPDSAPFPIDLQRVVEYYAKRI